MERNNTWTQIGALKTAMVEPRKKTDFEAIITRFNAEVGHNGAVLFAVCRGKVSEGIDFADSKGRAVVITGMPFLPLADPRVPFFFSSSSSISSPCSSLTLFL